MFTVTCNNCGSNKVNLEYWERDYDRNVLQIECSNCGQVERDGKLLKEGKIM